MSRPRLSPGQQVMVPAQLWDAVRADALAERDLVKGEALLAEAGTPLAELGAARVERWNARRRGFAALLDHPTGGTR